DFRVPLKESSDIPIPPVEFWNKLLIGLEQDNVFNRLILNRFSIRQILSGLVVALTAGLIGYGCLRLAQLTYPIDPHAPLAVPDTGPAPPPGGLVQQRHQTMLQEGKLWEAARDLARQSFWALGYGLGAAPARPVAPPSVTATGNWRRRRRLRHLVLRLWAL